MLKALSLEVFFWTHCQMFLIRFFFVILAISDPGTFCPLHS